MTSPMTLTPRELQTLTLMSIGDSNKAIADKLGVSEHTAKFHVNNVVKKLGHTTRAGAAVRGVCLGLVPMTGGAE